MRSCLPAPVRLLGQRTIEVARELIAPVQQASISAGMKSAGLVTWKSVLAMKVSQALARVATLAAAEEHLSKKVIPSVMAIPQDSQVATSPSVVWKEVGSLEGSSRTRRAQRR